VPEYERRSARQCPSGSALDWRRDIDLVAATITVNHQTRRGQMTTPKRRTRRTVPMTDTLLTALTALDTVRTGFVIRNLDGAGLNDNETKYHCYRICRAAGLPERGWHNLRHAFGTHAAMFGVNPWKLMLWVGRKRIDETMLYVHFACRRSEVTTIPTVGSSRRSVPVGSSAWQPGGSDREPLKGKLFNPAKFTDGANGT
jgi:hypothetical protein